MARYKIIDTSPRFLPVDLRQQLVAGTFEHALDWLVDHELDLTGFDARYKNDDDGAPAYPPGLLLKVVLFAYSRGMISSRSIERACREQVTFIALSGDEAPHFTTIAGFVSRLAEHIAPLFAKVLYQCDKQGPRQDSAPSGRFLRQTPTLAVAAHAPHEGAHRQPRGQAPVW